MRDFFLFFSARTSIGKIPCIPLGHTYSTVQIRIGGVGLWKFQTGILQKGRRGATPTQTSTGYFIESQLMFWLLMAEIAFPYQSGCVNIFFWTWRNTKLASESQSMSSIGSFVQRTLYHILSKLHYFISTNTFLGRLLGIRCTAGGNKVKLLIWIHW